MKREIIVSRVITNEDEFYSCAEMNQIWKHFQGQSSNEAVGRRFKFIAGYVEETNPEKNYGKNFSLYKHYKCEDGVTIIKEESVHSMMSSSPFIELALTTNEQGKLVIFQTGFAIEKTKRNRKIIAEQNIIVG